jgi:hypothetical protein
MDLTELTTAGAFVLVAFVFIFDRVNKHKSNKGSIPPAAIKHTEAQIEEVKKTQDKMDGRLRKVEYHVVAISTHLKIRPPSSDDY